MSEEVINNLELHGGWVLAVLEAKVAGQVADHVWDFLSGDQDSGVNSLLVLLSFGRSLVNSFFGLEDFTFVLSFMGVQFDSAEVFVVDSVWDGSRKVELGGGSNDVFLVDSSEWDTVDLEWTGDQKETRFELFHENDSFTSVSAGDEDKNGAWNDSFLKFLGALVFFTGTGGLKSPSFLVDWVESLGSADLTGLWSSGLFAGGGPSLSLVEDLFGVRRRSGVVGNSLIRHNYYSSSKKSNGLIFIGFFCLQKHLSLQARTCQTLERG